LVDVHAIPLALMQAARQTDADDVPTLGCAPFVS
jgi:hypothetical protein